MTRHDEDEDIAICGCLPMTRTRTMSRPRSGVKRAGSFAPRPTFRQRAAEVYELYAGPLTKRGSSGCAPDLFDAHSGTDLRSRRRGAAGGPAALPARWDSDRDAKLQGLLDLI